MKYKHLDSTDIFSFMCLKETEKINVKSLEIVVRARQRPSSYMTRGIVLF